MAKQTGAASKRRDSGEVALGGKRRDSGEVALGGKWSQTAGPETPDAERKPMVTPPLRYLA